MIPRLAAVLAFFLAAPAAFALPDWGRRTLPPEPEFEPMEDASMGSYGTCPVLAYRTDAAVPAVDLPADVHPATRKEMAGRVAAERKRLLLARRALIAIQDGAIRIVSATNQCSFFWERFEPLRAAAEAASPLEAAASIDVRASVGWKSRVVTLDAPALEKELASVKPATGRYPALCAPPSEDPVISVPAAEVPSEFRAAAAEIDEVGRNVAATLKAQREAFGELVKRLDGRGCRELTEAFEDLRSAERGLYFEYRRDALRDAAMKGLRWRRVTSEK